MNELQVFAIFDAAINAYVRPMYFQSKGQAIRAFLDEVNRQAPDNTMNAHPEDYSLYYLGSWNAETGQHENEKTPQRLALATDAK